MFCHLIFLFKKKNLLSWNDLEIRVERRKSEWKCHLVYLNNSSCHWQTAISVLVLLSSNNLGISFTIILQHIITLLSHQIPVREPLKKKVTGELLKCQVSGLVTLQPQYWMYFIGIQCDRPTQSNTYFDMERNFKISPLILLKAWC